MSEVLTASRIPLENYAEVVGAGEIEELRALAKPLRGRSIEMINSTAVGGGVAEILNRLVPLAEELDLGIRWDVMKGAEEFFDVTKSFHNALHGEPYHAKPKDFEIFLSYNEQNRATLPLDAEFVGEAPAPLSGVEPTAPPFVAPPTEVVPPPDAPAFDAPTSRTSACPLASAASSVVIGPTST